MKIINQIVLNLTDTKLQQVFLLSVPMQTCLRTLCSPFIIHSIIVTHGNFICKVLYLMPSFSLITPSDYLIPIFKIITHKSNAFICIYMCSSSKFHVRFSLLISLFSTFSLCTFKQNVQNMNPKFMCSFSWLRNSTAYEAIINPCNSSPYHFHKIHFNWFNPLLIDTCIMYLFWWGGGHCCLMHCDLLRSIVLPRIWVLGREYAD